jgi:hypothetical protein
MAVKATAYLAPGKHVLCTHYEVTQYGRDCATTQDRATFQVARMRANSVFALASAMKLSI